jgi:hypothetical protein
MLKVDQAFVYTFVNEDFGLPIAHENLPFKPTKGTAYAEILVIQNDATAYSLNDSNETDGIFRVILRYPADKGAIPAKTMADSIFSAFGVGARVCYQGDCVTVTSHSRQTGVSEDGWYKLVLTLRYKAFLGR